MTDTVLAIIILPLLVATAVAVECARWGCGCVAHFVRFTSTKGAKA